MKTCFEQELWVGGRVGVHAILQGSNLELACLVQKLFVENAKKTESREAHSSVATVGSFSSRNLACFGIQARLPLHKPSWEALVSVEGWRATNHNDLKQGFETPYTSAGQSDFWTSPDVTFFFFVDPATDCPV